MHAEHKKNETQPGLIAVAIGVTIMLAMLVAVCGFVSAFLWNNWGLNFSADFHAADLTARQAALVGAMVVLIRLRGSK